MFPTLLYYFQNGDSSAVFFVFLILFIYCVKSTCITTFFFVGFHLFIHLICLVIDIHIVLEGEEKDRKSTVYEFHLQYKNHKDKK